MERDYKDFISIEIEEGIEINNVALSETHNNQISV